ncbi:MAG: DUF934 domain-containing protein [Pseudomonadota bacterium]
MSVEPASPIQVWRDGAIEASDLRLLAVEDYLNSNRERGTAPLLTAGDQIETLLEGLGGDLSSVHVIALDFPSFADGRSYSKAQLLRDAHGYGGEIRAVGDVLPDQIELMLRVGFDALEASHPVTRKRLQALCVSGERHMQIATVAKDETPAGRFSWRRVG